MKLLLIEDDYKIAHNLKKGLEQQNHIVDMASDGLSGYDFALNEKYDVIILDWMLPEMDGPEILQKLRSEKITTPVLMLTARSASQDIVQGLDIGADDYLPKPFAFNELLARLRALSRRPHTATPNNLQSNDLELNPTTNTVTRDGKPIDLSKREFMLLEYMLRNKGKTISKEQILENVWNFDDDVLPNTAQVYIGYLRKKIDEAFPSLPNLIETVRGFGYRLNDQFNKKIDAQFLATPSTTNDTTIADENTSAKPQKSLFSRLTGK